LPEEFDELSPKEELYYQKPPFSTNEVFLGSKGGVSQLVDHGPAGVRQGYAEKKLDVIAQQAAKGPLLEQPKYKQALEQALDEVYKMQEKGYGNIRELTQKYKDKFSKKGTVQYGKKITTEVTTEGMALVNAIRAQAKKLGIDDVNTKKMEKALDFYRNKKVINQGDMVKIAKKFDVSYNTFQGTLFKKDYRKKIPLQYGSQAEKKAAIAKAYNDAKKIYSSPKYENLIRGTPETQLGHATDLYTQYVTPKDLIYTPAKINQEALKDIDAIHNAIYEKRNKLFKNKPAGWQKEVERLNVKGMNLADKSQGYKNFNIKRADGSTYKYGVDQMKTIDPMDLVGEKKLKDLTKADKALIELNRKNVLKAQSKIGKKEVDKTVAKILSDSQIPCIKGVGGNCTAPEDFKKGFNELVQRGAAGDKAAVSKLQKFTNIMKKAKGPLKWTGYGLLGEIGFMLPFAVGDYVAGKSWKRIIGNATDWGFGPMFGQSEDEEIIANLPEGSLGAEYEEALGASERLKALEDPNRNFPKGRIGMDPQRFQRAQAKVIPGAALDFKNKLTPFMEGPRNQFFNINKADVARLDLELVKERVKDQEAQRIQERRDRGFIAEKDWMKKYSYATGGLANLTRTVAPDSGPVSRGLRSLYIDDMD